MKSFASKFNKTSFEIDTTNYPYCKLSDIYTSKEEGGKDVVHPINGMWCRKSPLGDSPCIIDDVNKRLVNLPSHCGETVREILSDGDAIQAIKDGKVGYVIYEYESHAKKCYSISFVDM